MKKQLLKFFGVGILNTLVDLSVLNLLLYLGGLSLAWFMISKTISFGAGMLNSYLWNKYWIFQSNKSHLKEAIPFILISGLAWLVNITIASLLYKLFMAYLPNPFLINIIAVIASLGAFSCNFFGYKYIVFRK